ncbi:MAG: tetracycline resistance MFS efflux pump, partial [Candidatus Eremiobacteraeota bacterium]|nr:tetracycline resistance MFS efflux pump [Candidatus Eremiobacteraeota bacterium]
MQQPNGSPRNAAIVFIFITIAIDMIALGIIAPVLPRLIANFLHGDLSRAAEITGIFTTVWAAMQFFCSPLLGMLSDRVGRRPVI